MIINLVNKAKSDISYDIINFPDGHKHINFNKQIAAISNCISIKTRIISYDDLFILQQTVNIIRNINPSCSITLAIAYLLASRYDREMHEYDSFDLKIICNELNALNLRRIQLVEPHSNVATTLLDRVEVIHPLDDCLKKYLSKQKEDVCFVVPDLGAVKRVETFIASQAVEYPIVYSNKHRVLTTGQITGIDIFNPHVLKGNVIIYDDLCDGGRTFTELAKVLRAYKTKIVSSRAGFNTSQDDVKVVKKITLFVTNGLFSQGIDKLLTPNDEGSYVDEIYTTNSYKEQIDDPDLYTIQII